MTTSSPPSLYHCHRFPPDVIAQAVWLYFGIPLSLRMVEDLLDERGIIVSHQTIREWADKLRSYGVAKREVMSGVEHRSHKGPNNQAENSHQPTQKRERVMKWFKSPAHSQRFLSTHDPIADLFLLPRHEMRSLATQTCREIAQGVAA
ncbi:MAG: DDE-type integrase/transposase/recombinase [Sulfitobacter sp.]